MARTEEATLHMICGKIGSGKSTLAAELGRAARTVVVSQDAWLSALYADELKTGADYLRYSARLNDALAPHVSALLAEGVSVVLDFAANTARQRDWMRDLIRLTGVAHKMHVLEVPDDVCLARLHARNASGAHPFEVTDAQFHAFGAHFSPPDAGEGFEIVRHAWGG